MPVHVVAATEEKFVQWGQDTSIKGDTCVLATVTHRLPGKHYLNCSSEGGRVRLGWDVDPKTITFLAVDTRKDDDLTALALAVLTGNRDAAGALADLVAERWGTAATAAK
jgi:hypothetical protein